MFTCQLHDSKWKQMSKMIEGGAPKLRTSSAVGGHLACIQDVFSQLPSYISRRTFKF